MNTPEQLAPMLRRAGFPAPRIWSENLAHPWSVADLYALHTSCGMPARRLASLSKATRATCSERVRARLEGLSAEELIYRAQVLFAVAPRGA
jgi:hypothetical protein